MPIPETHPPSEWLKETILSTLAAFVKSHWRAYFLATFCLLSVGLIDLGIPWLVGYGIDQVRDGKFTHSDLWRLFGILVLMGTAMYGLRYAWRQLLFGTAYRLSVNLRNYLYQRLSHLGPAFFQRFRTGDLMARATNDIDAVEMSAGEAVLAAFDGATTLLLVVIMMMVVIDWRLAMVALIPFPVATYVFRKLGNRIHGAFSNSLDRFSDLNDHTQESLHGLKPMRALGLQHILKNDFDKLSNEAKDANLKVSRTDALFDPVVMSALGCSTLLSLIMGSWLIANGELTMGKLTSFYLYLGFLIWPMFAFGWFLNLYHRGSAAHQRLHELLQEPDTLPDTKSEQPVSQFDIHAHIEQFRYQPDLPPALGQINLQIPAGKVLGIVGPTGAGKTTLLRLLQRHYELTHGEILLGNQPLPDYSLENIRKTFVMVPQDPVLFSESLKSNIALGKPDASHDEILQAVNLAELGPDIEQLPHGLETIVGEKGVTLSGGQRQRVALARALLRDANILCLDDTLSAVDAETERRLLKSLANNQAQQRRTLIIVAHRLTAVKGADQIVVLNQGIISEQGNHADLISQQGWYAKMYAHQQLESDLE